MNIIFASVQCSTKKFIELFFDSKEKPGQQVQKYDRLLAEGLAMQEGVKVHAVTSLPITQGNYAGKRLNASEEIQENIDYHYLKVINIHRWKDIFTVVSAYHKTKELCKLDNHTILLCDILNAPVSLGAVLAAKVKRKKIIGIVTDVPDILFQSGDKAYHIVSNFLLKRCDAYILLTEQMKDLMPKRDKPYIVIEGIVDYQQTEENTLEGIVSKNKVCMYAGTLDQKYGIDLLVEGFIKANCRNTELHIYGDGDYLPTLLTYTKKYQQIKYFGVKMNEEIIRKQKEATLLVNPRPSSEEFTKYSFPSKNMEYMASGTPMLGTNLPGMPQEYKEFMYVLQQEDECGMALMFREVLQKDNLELMQKGNYAREYVLKQKNKKRQAEKVIRMMKEINDVFSEN